MKRVFSGIQPTGDLHIGNYLGAIRNWVKIGEQIGKDAIFCIVDYHAITIPHDRERLGQLTFDAALANMAAGLDPNKINLFAQSHVPEHLELGWIFSTQTPLGELERMTQFKDKSEQHSVLAGLLMYPVLQAADILLYKADTVPVGEDSGFLPGTEEEKMNPWMGALEDNLDVLNSSDDEAGDWGRAATRDLIRSRIKVKSLNFMRGRTFLNKFLIIDEAQNLTPKQMKTLITRAGPGTKVVCLGNIAQIDTPYLTEGSSGLTYVVDRFKGWSHSGHITLQRGERSRLADYAAEVL